MPGTNDRSERWAGGYVRTLGEGDSAHRVYVIHRMMGGHRYEISTKRSSESEAVAELESAEKNRLSHRGRALQRLRPLLDRLARDGDMPAR